MARIKRHRNARSRQKMKPRYHKPNIPELVYKFLIAEEAVRDVERAFATKCRRYGQGRRDYEEVVDSANSPRPADRSMGYKTRKNTGRVSKTRVVKRRPTSRDLPAAYLQKCVGGEETRKARRYIKKALDFAVESGYLIPSDPTYKVLRVSSDLMRSDSQRNRISTCDRTVSQEQDKNLRNTPTRLDDLQVQEQRRRGRRRRRRRSRTPRRVSRRRRRRRRRRGRGRGRSRSRSRSRTRNSSPQNPEEAAEDEVDDYEMDENDPKSNIHSGDVEREPKTTRSNPSDEEQSTKKAEGNTSDLSVDEDETDDEEEEKKATSATNS